MGDKHRPKMKVRLGDPKSLYLFLVRTDKPPRQVAQEVQFTPLKQEPRPLDRPPNAGVYKIEENWIFSPKRLENNVMGMKRTVCLACSLQNTLLFEVDCWIRT